MAHRYQQRSTGGQVPTWSGSPHDNPVGSRRIAEYIVANLANPVDATTIVLTEPPLICDAEFTVVPKTALNWPSSFNHCHNKSTGTTSGVVSIPILLYYMLFTPNYLVHISFAWDTEYRFRCDVALTNKLNSAATSFLEFVVPWLSDMVTNSSYIDEALECKRYDIQFVVSMGNQQLKAVYSDKVHAVLTACLGEPWNLTQTTPFFKAFEYAVDTAVVLTKPVVYNRDDPKAIRPDYIIDNAAGLITCSCDKTILFFLILFSNEIAFLRQWISATPEWKVLAGVPTQSIATLLDTLAAATHTFVVPPFYIETA
jgi:hypothetical protein